MLSRVADSLYWINRYVERAENISRFLEVSEAMALDCPPGSAEPWLPLVDANGDRKRFDEAYPHGHTTGRRQLFCCWIATTPTAS